MVVNWYTAGESQTHRRQVVVVVVVSLAQLLGDLLELRPLRSMTDGEEKKKVDACAVVKQQAKAWAEYTSKHASNDKLAFGDVVLADSPEVVKEVQAIHAKYPPPEIEEDFDHHFAADDEEASAKDGKEEEEESSHSRRPALTFCPGKSKTA